MKEMTRRYSVMMLALTVCMISSCKTPDSEKIVEQSLVPSEALNRVALIDKSIVQAVEELKRLRKECSVLERKNAYIDTNVCVWCEATLSDILRQIQECQDLVEGENKRIRDMLTTDTFGGELGKGK